MKQTTFASLSYQSKKKETRREKFLAEMDQVVHWAQLIALIESHYSKKGSGVIVMTTKPKRMPAKATVESLSATNPDVLKDLVKRSLEEILEAEMSAALGASPHRVHFMHCSTSLADATTPDFPFRLARWAKSSRY